jgi:hypothetical protein
MTVCEDLGAAQEVKESVGREGLQGYLGVFDFGESSVVTGSVEGLSLPTLQRLMGQCQQISAG